jgi:hypothetical protein
MSQKMTEQKYEFEVAFSFLACDEGIATRLNDLLQDRVSTFLYSEQQKALAGTDGEQRFNEVFAEKARFVVVLYRPEWGQTPWSRIEETAIRNRGHEHGYDFVMFIPLDEPATVPKWLPKAQLWFDFRRWGLNGAASVIEARLAELGGQPRVESIEDRAARFARTRALEREKEQFQRSTQGVQAAENEFDRLAQILSGQLESSAMRKLGARVVCRGKNISIDGLGRGLRVIWRCQFANSLEDAKLEVTLWDPETPNPSSWYRERPTQCREIEFKFEVIAANSVAWTSRAEGLELTSPALAEYLIKYYMDHCGTG